ncbi:MAG: hypothetical protein RL454_844 [Actinomycetota bacterium]
MPGMSFDGFRADSFDFFTELEVNNNKVWWEANRARYEASIRGPLMALLDEIAGEFGVPKVYRPYRDTRFSGDKTPYKDRAAAAIFGKSGTGLYLEVSAKGLDLGGGYWMPGKDQLERFRSIADDVRLFGDLEATVEELADAGFGLYQQDALKSAPRGFTPDHPRIHLLRLKHMVVEKLQAPADWMYLPTAAGVIASEWRKVQIWNDWLASMVGPSNEPPRAR